MDSALNTDGWVTGRTSDLSEAVPRVSEASHLEQLEEEEPF